MPVFSSSLEREVRLERMRPSQIDAAKEKCPAIFIPWGAMEWHGRQNPIGLDAMKAHEMLIALAIKTGGLVYPPVFFGSNGKHVDFPYTYMIDDAVMEAVALQLLRLLERDGFRAAILLSGHGPNLEILDRAVEKYRSGDGRMRVRNLVEWGCPGVFPDHAAKNETSAMMYLYPETVDMNEIAGPDPADLPVPERSIWMADIYKTHPMYGIAGADPREGASVELGREMTDLLVDHLIEWLDCPVPQR